MMDAWEKIDIIWMRVECGFDLSSIIADTHLDFAEDIHNKSKALRNTTSLANQSIGFMYYETLKIASRAVGGLNFSDNNSRDTWEKLIQCIELLPSNLLRNTLFCQLAMARLRIGDKKSFDELVQEKILPLLQLSPWSELNCLVITDLALPIFEFSPEEAQLIVSKLPYLLQNNTWDKVAYRILTQSNVCDPLDEEPPTVCLDLAMANKILRILEFTERDQEISHITHLLCHSISNDNCKLNENQKLDILTRLESIISKKIPDVKNITHKGYEVIINGDIERARRKSAKKSKALLPRNHTKIMNEAKSITNIADMVFVLTQLGIEFRDIQKELANDLLEAAFSLVPKIPNVRDRVNRLELIAESFSKFHNTTRTNEAIRMGRELAETLEGIERDTVLSSIIQTAHQINKDVAAQITEKIDDFGTRFSLDISINALELSKSPHKLSLDNPKTISEEVLNAAAYKMSKALISGRSISYPMELIIKWLASMQFLKFEASKEIVNWAVESLIRQAPSSEENSLAIKMISYLITNCELLSILGDHISSLSGIPDNLKDNFQGLSTNKKLFKIGERQKAIDFILNWLKENSPKFVKICDPYFDYDQVWILKGISSDSKIKIITTGKPFCSRIDPINKEKIRTERQRIQSNFQSSWADISNQSPPATLIVIHGVIFDEEKDDFHDRYIITDKAGLSIGTSLNGLGNKEFFITILTPDDVRYVSDTYIDPKLRIDEFFSSVIYFELDGN
jgi:hypothetical protein